MTITAQLEDGRTLEFPDGTDPAVIQGTVKKLIGATPAATAPQQRALTEDNPNPIDKFILEKFGPQLARAPDLLQGPSGRLGASRIRGALKGAADLPVGAAQLGANAFASVAGFGNEGINQFVAKEEADYEAEKASVGREGFDVPRLIGGIAGPGGMGAAKLIKPAAKFGGRILQGGGVGTVAGATAPVTDSENYWTTKGAQTALGLIVGTVIPAGIEAGKGITKAGKGLTDLLTKKGAGRILTDYQKQIVGKQELPEVISKLRNPPQNVPGYKPTAAEVLVDTPAGSPLVRHQQIQAEQPGGISAEFGRAKQFQEAALDAAYGTRDKETNWMRTWALDRANRGGVKAHDVASRIDKALSEPGKRSSDVIAPSLTQTRDKILDLANSKGIIDANDLYTIRKELGNTISKNAKESASWDKRLAAKLQNEIQDYIDDAITKAGGKGWKQYLNIYSKRSGAIKQAKELREATPIQTTNIGGGRNIAEETRIHLPQMLSRPMMLTNAILKRVGRGVETRIDPQATQRYLDPELLAKELARVPVAERLGVLGVLMERGHIPLIVGTGQEGIPQ